MRLIKKITIVCIILLVMSIFTAAEVVALDCPPGKTGVTIVTPPGKVVEICVAPAAVPYIGGPSDVVISATCPCFTVDIDSICDSVPTCTNYNPDPSCLPQGTSCVPSCTDIPSGTNMSLQTALGVPAEFGTGLTMAGLYGCISKIFTSCLPCPVIWIQEDDITEEQYQACRAILLNSETWALNCDGS